MPNAEKSAARSGIEMTPPQKRGATTRASGFTAIISIAASCSVVFMSPISAVVAQPARSADIGEGLVAVGGSPIVERHGAVGRAVDELTDERIVRGAYFLRRSRRDDASLRHEVEIVDDLPRLVDVVGHQHRRDRQR